MGQPPTTLRDIAKSLGTSIGTVHRALHDNPGVSPETKAKVLQMARNLGYRPNLAARYLSSRKTLRISVNTPQGTTSFWDEVRAGIREEAASILLENVEFEFRTCPRLGEGEEEALEAAIREKVDGIIIFPSQPQTLRSVHSSRRSREYPGRLCRDRRSQQRSTGNRCHRYAGQRFHRRGSHGTVSGRQQGSIAITVFDMAITEHAEKYARIRIHPANLSIRTCNC